MDAVQTRTNTKSFTIKEKSLCADRSECKRGKRHHRLHPGKAFSEQIEKYVYVKSIGDVHKYWPPMFAKDLFTVEYTY